MLEILTMSCCACRQISGLHHYKKKAKQAMLEFCKKEFHKNSAVYGLHGFEYNLNKFNAIYTFYIFNGIVGYRNGRNPGGEMGTNLGYVEAFRDFIRDNELGEVVETKTGFNRVNNPTHNILCCLWKPRPAVLRKWYLANRS